MIRKTLLTILLTFVTLSYGLSQGVIKNFFKYSTLYTSFSQSNSMVQEDTYAVMDGLLTVVPMEYEPNYTFSFGLRKLARFKYEIKATNFYDGSEVSMSEEANIGNVSGFEYVLERSSVRLTGQESTDQRYFLRHLSKWMVAELDFLENGRADIKYLEAALKLRIQIGTKFNLTAGVAGRRHPAYTVAPIEDWIEENSGAWWLLAYDYDYVDNWVYTDSNDDGEYTIGEWSDWEWYGPEGNLVAETDSEFRRYQYGSIVNTYNRDIRSQLPNQYQLSAAIGADFYHYSEDFWVHSWVNVMPYHKELGDEEYSYARVAGDTWVDYNAGVVFGANIGKHLGVFAEGNFSEYWGRPYGSLTMGINYVIK